MLLFRFIVLFGVVTRITLRCFNAQETHTFSLIAQCSRTVSPSCLKHSVLALVSLSPLSDFFGREELLWVQTLTFFFYFQDLVHAKERILHTEGKE